MRKFHLILILLASQSLIAQVSLSPFKTKPAGSDADMVCIADLNNDGRNDVVLNTRLSGSTGKLRYPLMIYFQNEHDSLDNPITLGVSSYGVSGLDAGDVNDDGLVDIIVCYRDSLGVFEQVAPGTFSKTQQFHVGSTDVHVQIGDLNNDSRNDILVAPWSELYFKVFYQNNNGFTIHNFSKPVYSIHEVNIADISGDGLNDVVFLRRSNDASILVHTQNSSGLLNNDSIYYSPPGSFNQLYGFDIGDLNGDGLMDVAASKGGNKPNSWINIWFQHPTSGTLLTQVTELAAYDIPEPLKIVDLNCDGKNEIITIHGGWQALSVYEQDKSGNYNSFNKHSLPYASHYHPKGFDIGDINNDGLKDLAIGDYNHGLVLLFNESTSNNAIYDTSLVSTLIDTLNSRISTNQDTIQTATTDTVDDYLIITHKTFVTHTTSQIDSIRYHSTLLSHSIICGNHIFDTIFKEDYLLHSTIVSSDTTLLKKEQEKVNPLLNVQLYPNPTSGALTLKLPSPFDTSNVQLIIHSIHGSLVSTQILTELGVKRTLDISDYASGVYLVKLKIGSYDYFTRVVKE